VGNYQQRPVVRYSNVSGGTVPTLTVNGFSNQFPLHDISDISLIVNIGAAPGGTTPTLQVGLDMQDGAGNWLTQVVKTATLNAQGLTILSAGLHAASPNQIVLSGIGRVSWALTGTGPVFSLTAISLIGR
jgi:hypothetical protein